MAARPGSGPTLYDVLGAQPDAPPAELRRAFVKAARRNHPDVHVNADARTRREAERRMRELNEAWNVLGDPDRRRDYDRMLRAGAAPFPSGAPRPPRQEPQGREASPSSSEPLRDWRSYASPGPGGARHRSALEQLFTLSPVLCLVMAGFLGFAGVLIGWPPFFAMALVALLFAAAGFFILPLWSMARSNRARIRRPRPLSSYPRRPGPGTPRR